MNRYGTFRIFTEVPFFAFEQRQLELLKQSVRSEKPEYLVNVNEKEYIEHLVSEFSIDPLIFHFDKVEASTREAMIPAEQFPQDYNVYAGKSYPKPVYKYHVPVSGNLDLLNTVPTTHVLMSYDVSLENGEICFEIVDFSGSGAGVKNRAEPILEFLKTQSGYLAVDVTRFNKSVEAEAENLFRARKQELLQRSEALANLGVPIQKSSNVPSTFAVPASRKQVIAKPAVSGTTAKNPDPTLDEGIYQDILQTIQDTGKVFERLPRTYADKDEEALRDHLILQLEPRFEYSTTGETFNKNGKTDILIRHEKNNIFVAECKFWGGAKKHGETIDQILSYLTWRDSKTAIVYFVDTKEMAAPLKAIEESTSQHSCFEKLNGKKQESWFDHTFHLPGDKGIPIRLSILCFHLPKPVKS